MRRTPWALSLIVMAGLSLTACANDSSRAAERAMHNCTVSMAAGMSLWFEDAPLADYVEACEDVRAERTAAKFVELYTGKMLPGPYWEKVCGVRSLTAGDLDTDCMDRVSAILEQWRE